RDSSFWSAWMSRFSKLTASSWGTWEKTGCGRLRSFSPQPVLMWTDFFSPLNYLLQRISSQRININCTGAKRPERIDQMSTLLIPQTATTTWNIDPAHATAEFKVKHMMIANVKGQFSKVSGVLVHDESDPTKSHVEASVEAASIETREPQRDAHLKSPDFFH